MQAGSIVGTTTTDRQGNYQFTEAGAGRFTVEVIVPGTLASKTKGVDITKGQQPGNPATANFEFPSSVLGGNDTAPTSFTAALANHSGHAGTVTYQVGDLDGTAESIITVSGDSAAEGTGVVVTINGTSVGTVAINSSGTGTLIVPTSSLSTTVAAGGAVTVGTLRGAFVPIRVQYSQPGPGEPGAPPLGGNGSGIPPRQGNS